MASRSAWAAACPPASPRASASASRGANRGDARVAACHVVDEGDFARGRFLTDGRDRDAGGQLDVAAIRLELAEQHAEQTGLAGAVRSDHTDLLPALDHKARAIENLDATAAKLDVVQANHRAGPWRRPVAPPVDLGDCRYPIRTMAGPIRPRTRRFRGSPPRAPGESPAPGACSPRTPAPAIVARARCPSCTRQGRQGGIPCPRGSTRRRDDRWIPRDRCLHTDPGSPDPAESPVMNASPIRTTSTPPRR